MGCKFEIEHLEGCGITAKVVNLGKLYSTYRDFADASGYPDAVGGLGTQAEKEKTENARLLLGKTVKILAKGKHESYNAIIYVVESDYGERFLFGEEGLEISRVAYFRNVVTDSLIEYSERVLKEVIQRAYAEGFRDARRDREGGDR